jgi:uncharacterized protein
MTSDESSTRPGGYAGAADPGGAPLDSEARIGSIDVVRGLALLGILVANVRQMFLPWDIASFAAPSNDGQWLAWLDWGLFDALVDLKFITLFSLLFGIGFALQSERLSKRHAGFEAIYLRRVALLALFGLLHGLLLYPAEVLLPYALAGLLLFAARSLPTANLYRVGLVLVMATVVWGFQIGALGRVSVPITLLSTVTLAVIAARFWERNWRLTLVLMTLAVLLSVVALLLYWDPSQWGESVASEHARARQELAAMRSDDAAAWPAEFRVRQGGEFADLLQLHASQYSQLLVYVGIFLLWRTLGLFMIGAALFRSGVVTRSPIGTWRRVAWVGLGIGMPLSVLATVLQFREIHGLSDWRWPECLHVASAFPLAVGLCARVMVNAQLGTHRWWYSRMESAGRMALSNYVGQSFVMAALAEPWGLGLYGKLTGPTLTALAVVTFTLLAALSHAWLRCFTMGPLEWLWRCGTYWRWLPLRRN